MHTIPGQEIADIFRKAIRKETEVVAVGYSWNDAFAGNAHIRIDGYDLLIFNDCLELDYVDTATAPDGRTGDFDKWFDDGDEPVSLINQEEVARMERILEEAPVIGPIAERPVP